MRKVVASADVSLDGVVTHPVRWSGDFWTEEVDRLNVDLLFGNDALLLGRGSPSRSPR